MSKLIRKIKRIKTAKSFKKHGANFHIGDDIFGNLSNVEVGNQTYIGDRVCFNALLANVHIGNYVVIADDVLFITGNHRFDVVGKRIIDINNN